MADVDITPYKKPPVKNDGDATVHYNRMDVPVLDEQPGPVPAHTTEEPPAPPTPEEVIEQEDEEPVEPEKPETDQVSSSEEKKPSTDEDKKTPAQEGDRTSTDSSEEPTKPGIPSRTETE